VAAIPHVKTIHYLSYAEYVTELKDSDFVVVMTPGHEFDFAVVERILQTKKLPYVAVIGSRKKAAAMYENLKKAGFDEEAIQRITCPAGLPLGNNKPEEIAISIAAQILLKRDEYYGKG
jgi:xanthine dehydrogenase accessory factor